MAMVKMKILKSSSLLFLALMSATVGAVSDPVELMKPCMQIQDNAERLSCYDKASKQGGLNAIAGEIVGDPGKWQISESVSPIDDTRNVTALLEAELSVPGQLGLTSVKPYLIVRCKEGSFELFMNWQRYLSTQSLSLLLRFDKEPAFHQVWSVSTNYKSLFSPNSEVTANKLLAGSQTLFVQVTPYGSNPISTRFDLSGSRVAVRKALSACRLR